MYLQLIPTSTTKKTIMYCPVFDSVHHADNFKEILTATQACMYEACGF